MKISSEKLQLSILNQMSKGKTPHPEYYEGLGVSGNDFDAAIADLQERHFIDSGSDGWNAPGSFGPSDGLDHFKITVDGRNHLSENFEMTAVYRDLKE